LSGRRLPLRARLMLLVLACTVPLIAMGLAREYTIYRDARARIGDGLLSQARLLSLAVERDIHLRVSAMEVLAASTPLTEGTFDGFRPQAQAFLALQPPGAAIGVADADGRLVATFGASRQATPALRLAPASVRAVFEDGQTHVSNLEAGPDAGEWTFRIDVPVRRDGVVVYDLILRLTPAILTSLVDGQRLADNGVATVTDTANIVVARVPRGDQFIGHPVVSALRPLMNTEAEGIHEVPTLEGTPAIAAFAHVGLFNWRVVVGAPAASVEAPVREAISHVVIAGFLMLLVALSLALLAARRITAPIAALARIAREEGQAGILPDPATGLVEIDEVAGALRHAAAERRQAADAMVESEQRFRALFEGAPSGAILIDPDTTEIIDCNEVAAATMGYSVQEFRGLHAADFRSATSVERIRSICQAVANGAVHRYETRLVGRNGEHIVVNAVAPVRVGGRTIVLVTQIDITELRQVEERLQDNAVRLGLATEAADLGTWQRDLRTNDLVCSSRYRTLLGLPADSPVNFHGFLAALHPDDRQRVQDALVASLEGRAPYDIEFRAVWPDGSVHWIRSKGRPRRDEAGQPISIQGVVLGIDQEKEGAARLAESEERLQLARDGADLGIWDWNIATGSLTWTEHQWHLHGLEPRAEAIGPAEWYALLHPEDREPFRAAIKSVVSDPARTLVAEYRIRPADGSTRRILARGKVIRDDQGRPVRMVGINMDVTARYEAEQARDRLIGMLEAERARLSDIVQALPLGLGIVDASGHYLLINAMMERFATGRLSSHDDGLAETWIAEDAEGRRLSLEESVVRRALRGETIVPGIEFLARRADGSDTWTRFGAAPLRTEKGRVREVFTVLQDIDAEKRLLELEQRANLRLEQRVREEVAAREAAQQRAAHAERMQALGQIAGGIAHDFNNVLQAVSGGASLIERRPNDPDRVLRNVRMVADAAKRGAAITSRLLAFSRRGVLRAEPVDAGTLLADLSEVLSHTLGGKVACAIDVLPGLPRLFADRGQLETVLVNLATNARDAMPRGGTLTMAASADRVAPGQPHQTDLGPGQYIQIDVRDTGNGMEPEVLARVTEPFFTTKEPGKGTGLGLAMAKGFAEQSGGGLAISSAVGQGTSISLWLPVVEAEVAEDARPVPEDLDGSLSGPHVLLVDDDPIVREVLGISLQEAGFAVTQAENGTVALAVLQDGHMVDILVSDLTMPGMDGLALIRSAQLLRLGLPAILLTGYAGDGAALAVGGAISGTFSLLRKPVSGSQLVDRIAALLATDVRAVV
jgi:PAS domain S-box-containing protein